MKERRSLIMELRVQGRHGAPHSMHFYGLLRFYPVPYQIYHHGTHVHVNTLVRARQHAIE